MLTLKDCMDMTELEVGEIEAIAEHERIPQIAATELGHLLLSTAQGRQRIGVMIADDLEHARQRGNERHAVELSQVLSKYRHTHPDGR